MTLTPRYTVDRMWEDKVAVIVCSGPSLSVRQVRHIARARMAAGSQVRVIAVNDAVYPCFWADWLHACDFMWWNEYIQGVHRFPGIKTCLESDVPSPWVSGYLENTGADGFDEDPSCCRTGNNSGYQAIHIAMHAGASKIILVGMDMKVADNGESHFFGEHRISRPADFATNMIPHFKSLLPAMERRGVVCVNSTPGSALDTFRFEAIDSALPL